MTIQNIQLSCNMEHYKYCEIQKMNISNIMSACPELIRKQLEEKSLGMKKARNLCNFLLERDIFYKLCIRHKEVGGCADSAAIYQRYQSYLDGSYSICKNLFLHEKKGTRSILLITEEEKHVNMAKLKEALDSGGLRPATEEELKELLGTYYGNVSIFNIQNDDKKQVELVMDQDLLEKDYLAFHPNYNGASIFLKPSRVVKYLQVIHRRCNFIDVPIKEENNKIYKKEGMK